MPSEAVTTALEDLVTTRNWTQFHTPENLAKSIAIEAAELLECYQWGPNAADPQAVRYELADVLTYCYHLARQLGVDPDEIVLEKLEVTKRKYPVDKAWGSMEKYDQT